MNCPECISKNTKVSSTYSFEGLTKRYCICLDCGACFTTIEKYNLLLKRPTSYKLSTKQKIPP